ncbi:MAG: hypothetical protein NTX30_23860 [Deltaproteobacteria bacterium]|nr:hypothetical protein [Deltaproteobacteria bacterium]
MKYLDFTAKFTICCLALYIYHCHGIAYAKCPASTLKDMLNFENPRVIKHLSEIENMEAGYREAGIILCDGYKILSGWIFKESIHPPCTGQHVYIFEENHVLRAVIWVEKSGKAVRVPPCPKDDCSNIAEAAHVISGDVYTWKEVQPGDGIVLLQYPTIEWAEGLKNQTEGCTKSR